MQSLILIALISTAFSCAEESGNILEAGSVAPDFRAQDLTGRVFYLNAELRRPVLLTFYATWCAPCQQEIPLLIDVRRKFGDRVTILCVVVDAENIDKVRALATELSIPYPMLIDEGRQIMSLYKISELPVTFLIGTDGRIHSRFQGIDDQTARALIEALRRITGGT